MNPFTEVYVYLPFGVQYVLTVLWFVGLITAFNFMDGLDGLSGLLALVSGVTFFVVAIHMNQPESAFMAVIFVAAVTGFLRFNLPPAKVYMGDSGAYLLGFMLAAISLHGAFKQATVISLSIPMLAMGVPIFDSILVVVRRLLAHKPAHVADSSNITHIHFRLLKNGMKPSHAVLLIFLFSACLNLASIIILLAF
jgi:UDP-N-acetylmuramyl pentapeptide phosphotransferase/UDP-N-acetylglucosamine-1-phosphate transferase